MITPLFLLSLPRSGSTYLQALVASHEHVSTAPEPWALLPLLAARRKDGAASIYGHYLTFHAIEAFLSPLRNDAWDRAVRAYATRLYSDASLGERYFLDKTPRYSLFAHELWSIFPDARFLVLWRNPIDLVGSILQTWSPRGFNLEGSKVDLFDGLESLVEFARMHSDSERVAILNYEELVAEPEDWRRRIYSWLGISDMSRADDLAGLSSTVGKMGDPNIRTKGTAPSRSLRSRETALATSVRRHWLRKYLNWIGASRLRHMGYDLDELFKIIDHATVDSRIILEISDVFGYTRHRLKSHLQHVALSRQPFRLA